MEGRLYIAHVTVAKIVYLVWIYVCFIVQMLQSELEELKKGKGVAHSQAPPTSPRISEPNGALRQQMAVMTFT